MELVDYKFDPKQWPPPQDRRDTSRYLFGFDQDNQPYVIRWEHQKGYQGWVASSLCENKASEATAVPRHFIGDTVGKLIKWWADAPALMSVVYKARASKRKEEENQYE